MSSLLRVLHGGPVVIGDSVTAESGRYIGTKKNVPGIGAGLEKKSAVLVTLQ